MPNLRIIYDNAADGATTLAASTTAGTLVAANMQTDRKSQVHRSTGTSVSYTATWTAGENIGGLALPATNLSAEATMRGRLWADTARTVLLTDTGILNACPGLNMDLWDWNTILDANAFAYGGASKSSMWFDAHYFAKACQIDLADPTNPAGYIDCSRLVIGAYWSPTWNFKWGSRINSIDKSVTRRNDADDAISDRRQQHDSFTFDLTNMPEADRARLLQIIRNVGTARNLFVSLLPQNTSPVAEQDGMIFGHRASSNPIAVDMPFATSNTIELEGW